MMGRQEAPAQLFYEFNLERDLLPLESAFIG